MKVIDFLAPPRRTVSGAWIALGMSTAFLIIGLLFGSSLFVVGVFAAFAYRDFLDLLIAYNHRNKKTEEVKLTGEVL